MTIHYLEDSWPEPVPELPTMFSGLDGHIDFVYPPSLPSLRIAYEDNEPERLEVHIAVPKRYALLDDIADDVPFRINNLQGAY
jgi:hypothetical protein